MKRCKLCKLNKDPKEFYNHSNYQDGKDRRCIECVKSRNQRKKTVCPSCGTVLTASACAVCLLRQGLKRCWGCGETKTIWEFTVKKDSKDGLAPRCRTCAHARYEQNKTAVAAQQRRYNETHAEQIRAYHKNRYLKNRGAILSRRKEWRSAHKADALKREQISRMRRRAKALMYERKRKLNDPNFALSRILRSRIGKAITNQGKGGSAVQDLGCSIHDARLYLESKFQEGWTWQNHGAVWEIDHVVPLCAFDLTDPEQFKKACHYTNLQPLGIEEHRLKTIEDRKLSLNRPTKK